MNPHEPSFKTYKENPVKRLQPFMFSAALLFLAACGQDAQPAAATPSFNFSVDPAAGSVNLTSADAQTLKTLQIGECGSGQPRTLFAGEELALTSYDAAFLPGNLLQITAEFTNVTDFTFEQPFTFTQAESSQQHRQLAGAGSHRRRPGRRRRAQPR